MIFKKCLYFIISLNQIKELIINETSKKKKLKIKKINSKKNFNNI